jgi:Mycothiol maleylpyruvate isomerase N-terminal domain
MLAQDERAEFAVFLATLSPRQWQAPTLCAGWRVRDVVAHVISYDELDVRGLLAHVVRGRFPASSCQPRRARRVQHAQPRAVAGVADRSPATAGPARGAGRQGRAGRGDHSSPGHPARARTAARHTARTAAACAAVRPDRSGHRRVLAYPRCAADRHRSQLVRRIGTRRAGCGGGAVDGHGWSARCGGRAVWSGPTKARGPHRRLMTALTVSFTSTEPVRYRSPGPIGGRRPRTHRAARSREDLGPRRSPANVGGSPAWSRSVISHRRQSAHQSRRYLGLYPLGGGSLDDAEEGDLRARGQRGLGSHWDTFGERSSGCGGRPFGEQVAQLGGPQPDPAAGG